MSGVSVACVAPVAFVEDSDALSVSEMLEIVGADDGIAADAAENAGAPDAELPRGGIDLKNHMSAIEIGLIRKALRDADGTVAGAARLLNIRRTTLVEKLRKYRLSA